MILFTSDIDWAPEFMIEDFDKCVVNAEANPTSTHNTKFITVGSANATDGSTDTGSDQATTAKGKGDTRRKKNHHLLPILKRFR